MYLADFIILGNLEESFIDSPTAIGYRMDYPLSFVHWHFRKQSNNGNYSSGQGRFGRAPQRRKVKRKEEWVLGGFRLSAFSYAPTTLTRLRRMNEKELLLWGHIWMV
jgi:hypothetical protein